MVDIDSLSKTVSDWLNAHRGLSTGLGIAGVVGTALGFARKWLMNLLSHYFIRRYDRVTFPSDQVKKRVVQPAWTHIMFEREHKRLLLSGAIFNTQPRATRFRFADIHVRVERDGKSVDVRHTSDSDDLSGYSTGQFRNHAIELDDSQTETLIGIMGDRDAVGALVEANFECWIASHPIASIEIKQFMWCGARR